MKKEILTQEPEKIEIKVEDTNTSVMNAIRRTILSQVPTMAMERVYFYKNTSSMWDEYIAHRIGLIELETDLGLKFPDECCGGNCSSCSAEFSLEERGPKTVRAKDIKSNNPEIKPVNDETPIITLEEGQELSLEMTAVLGRGKEHAKWQPGNATYKQMPELVKKGEIKDPEKIVEACPKDLLEVKNGELEIKDETKCMECGECEKISDKIKIEAKDTEFVLKITSNGSLSPQKILNKAIERIGEKTEEFVEKEKEAEEIGEKEPEETEEDEETEESEEAEEHECEECGKTFTSKQGLKIHKGKSH